MSVRRTRVNVLDYKQIRQMTKEIGKEAMTEIRAEMREIIEKALADAEQHVRDEIASSHRGRSGNLEASVYSHFDWQRLAGYIQYDETIAPYAKYVEYGTGIVGMENPGYPLPADWEFDVNDHGSDGWFFKAKNDNGALRRYWTQGQPGSSHMYNAQEYLKTLLPDVIKVASVRGEH